MPTIPTQKNGRWAAKHAAVNKAILYMMHHYQEPLDLSTLAQQVGVSKFSLIRSFQQARRETPMKWLWNYRIQKSIEWMQQQPHATLQQIAQLSGFSSQSHYCRIFKKVMMITPAYYRRILFSGSIRTDRQARGSYFP